MTAIWGPLGWLTLHSVAGVYSDTPTNAEKQLMTVWLDLFRDTITCHYCRSHFTDMYAMYRQRFPGMFDSRQEFVAFTFRAHNAVNRRLNKPIYNSVSECMATLRNAIQSKTAREYRTAYLNHIRRYWSTFQDVSGIVALKKINQMIQIETDYVISRDNNFGSDIEETVVALPREVLERSDERSIMPRVRHRPPPPPRPAAATVAQPLPPTPYRRVGFQITAGGLRLR
jgi:hypothetical protein